MLIKKMMFLAILLLLIGCGIMNNPQDDGDTTKISKIFTADLDNTEINQEFIDNTSVVGLEDVTYRIIDSNASLNLFIQDLNDSATQSSFVKMKATQWITLLTDANVDFQQNNILFYTYIWNLCQYQDTIVFKENNAEIMIDITSELCNPSATIYVYAYRVSKEIKQITVKVEGMDDLNITNSSLTP